MSDLNGCTSCGAKLPDESGKCCRFVGVKLPDDLFDDLTAMTGLVQQGQPPKALSEVIKECIRFRITFLLSVRAGYSSIRTAFPLRDVAQSGLTNGAAVKPFSASSQ